MQERLVADTVVLVGTAVVEEELRRIEKEREEVRFVLLFQKNGRGSPIGRKFISSRGRIVYTRMNER